VRGALPPYSIGHAKVDAWTPPLPIPTGAQRGLSAPINNFAMEVMVDALATQNAMSPFEFRRSNLGNQHPRLTAVLNKLESVLPPEESESMGRGIACGIYKGVSFVAIAADVRVDQQQNSISVTKLTCVHECGLIVNPNSVEAQVQGNLIWGMGLALKEDLKTANHQVTSRNFDDYKIMTQNDTPEMDIHLLHRNDLPPAGAGEAAMMPVPAAIANGVFDATGIRLTHLPLTLPSHQSNS